MPLHNVPKFPQLITSNASYLVYKNEWVQCLVVWMSCKCEGNDRVPVTDPAATRVLYTQQWLIVHVFPQREQNV
jgi:hypothetical protein